MKTRLQMMLLLAVPVLAAGCAIEPASDYYSYGEPVVVYAAPPPVRYEYAGSPPVVGALWIDGYWNWGGSQYIWVPGRWETPRPGYRWAPHRWERDGNRWRQYGGHWEHEDPPRRHVPPQPYVQPQPQPQHYSPSPQQQRGDRSDNRRVEPRPYVRPDPELSPVQERYVAPRHEREGRQESPDNPRSRSDRGDRARGAESERGFLQRPPPEEYSRPMPAERVPLMRRNRD